MFRGPSWSLANAILSPSGEKVAPLSKVRLLVTLVCCVPSAFITKMLENRSLSLWKAILLPSGDHSGSKSSAAFPVSCSKPVPSRSIVKISKSPSGLLTPSPVVRSEAKAIKPLAPGKVASASRAVPANAARSSLAETIAAPPAAILPAQCVFLSAVFIVCLVPFCMRSGTRCPDPRLPRGSFRPGISGPGLHLDETRGPVSGVDGTVAEEPRDGGEYPKQDLLRGARGLDEADHLVELPGQERGLQQVRPAFRVRLAFAGQPEDVGEHRHEALEQPLLPPQFDDDVRLLVSCVPPVMGDSRRDD